MLLREGVFTLLEKRYSWILLLLLLLERRVSLALALSQFVLLAPYVNRTGPVLTVRGMLKLLALNKSKTMSLQLLPARLTYVFTTSWPKVGMMQIDSPFLVGSVVLEPPRE